VGETHKHHDSRFDLFDKAVAGQLADDERNELEQLLKSSPEVRREYRNYVALHAELASAVRMARARDVIYDEVRSRARVGRCESGVSGVLPASSSMVVPAASSPACADRPRPAARCLPATTFSLGGSRLLGIWATIASVLVVMGGAAYWWPSASETVPVLVPQPLVRHVASQPPAPVATIAALAADTNLSGQWYVGRAIYEGDVFEVDSGSAQISVGVGAEIAATGPCALRMLARDRVQLLYGDVVVHVAEWAKGFTIVTDAMDVVDLGTTFRVSAKPGEQAEASVIKGLVRVHPRGDELGQQRGLLLAEGEALVIDNEGLRQIKQQLPDTTAQAIEFGKLVPYRPVAMHNTGVGLNHGDEDPHWRVVSGPAEDLDPRGYASVCVPHERYLPNQPHVSQWVSISRWREAAPQAVYTFRTEFDLTGYDISTIQLFGRLLADNGVEELRVNGRPAQVESWNDMELGQRFEHAQFRFVNVTDGLVEGVNEIEVDVYNGGVVLRGQRNFSLRNHMALRVEWYAFGRKIDGDVAINSYE
jgi:ferric-dicitrate binding protein FerR (iron transport regulator)